MAIHNRQLRRGLYRIFPILAALVALLVSLVMVSDVQTETSDHNRAYLWVLIFTIVALALLLMAITARVVSLFNKVRRREPGAQLAARWVRNFLVLSLPPALIVYFFSAYFLTQTIDNWFDVQVEGALADSLQLGQEFVDRRTLDVRNSTRRLARRLETLDENIDVRTFLVNNVSASGPVDLSLLNSSGSQVATASYSTRAELPERPADYVLLQAMERGEYAAAEPSSDGRLLIRVLQRVPAPLPGQFYALQAIYPLPEQISKLTSNIETEYFRYQNVNFLRNSLKQSLLLILTLVLGLTVLLAILAALRAARRMVNPLSDLARATERVARGDLAQLVQTSTRDEIGFLAQSFNDMTSALHTTSEEAERGRARLQAQGEYLETVLGSLSAGVLTLHPGGQLVRVNRAAEEILGLPGGEAVGRSMDKLAEQHGFLEPLGKVIGRHVSRGHLDWQEEVRIERQGSPLVLLMRGSVLPRSEFTEGGHVVVFDDVTILNQAQRDAAWAEVARRMAHEVKNPLTPIRLAAERLRMKLMDKLSTDDAQLLDRSATTIVSQVEALRKLVDAFGDYARAPQLDRAQLDINALIGELAHLYEQARPDMSIQLDLAAPMKPLHADKGQLRQLLHNLIRNAAEAVADGAPVGITISTRMRREKDTEWLDLIVSDEGPGFPEQLLKQPFEPYVTSKPQGSGLGLAICRKIVVDHDGSIKVSNRKDAGARVTISLPLRPGKD